MGRFYGLKILRGEMTIDEVRSYWLPMVEEWLDKNGTTSGLS